MARTGISYEVVAQAAEQLKAEGKNATIENIRFITGTGSSTTIAMHLRTWRGHDTRIKSLSEKESLPESIVINMKGLWAHVIQEAQAQFTPTQRNLEQTIADLKIQFQAIQKENVDWQQQYEQLKLEKEITDHENITLKQLNHTLENEKIAMTAAQEGLLKQLQEKQERIDEALRLNQQIQANLEHFRESTREQRMIDEQRHQQTQLQLEKSVTQIRQELTHAKQENIVLQNQNQQINSDKNNLETQITKLNKQYASVSERLTESLNEMTKKIHAEQHWQEQHDALSIKWNEQNKLFIELQTQHALSLQELAAIKTEAKEIADQNKLLAHEKWILGQEKAQLYGAHKQLQEMRGIKEEIL